MKIETSREQLKALAKVAGKCSLINLFLLNCHVERTLDAHTCKKIFAELKFEGSFFKKEGQDFSAKASLTLRGLPQKNERNHIIKISNEYVLNYKLKIADDIGEKEINNFCNINAIYNAWPFFREFVISMTNRMNMPPFVLPLLSIASQQPKRKKEPSISNNE